MEQVKKREIKEKLRKVSNDFFASIKDERIRELFKKHSFIAGGAIASLILNEKPNDYDFYFDDPIACLEATNYFLNLMDIDSYEFDVNLKENGVSMNIAHGILKKEKIEGEKYQPIAVTSNAFSFTDGIQFVVRYADNPIGIIKNFDFTHSKGLYHYELDELVVPEQTEKAIKEKNVTYTGSAYPLASLIRTRKFVQRGWKINAGQYLKIALQLNELDLLDPAVLREQLVGVDLFYFGEFLSKLETVGMEKIDFDKGIEKMFEMIDEAFEQNEEDNF